MRLPSGRSAIMWGIVSALILSSLLTILIGGQRSAAAREAPSLALPRLFDTTQTLPGIDLATEPVAQKRQASASVSKELRSKPERKLAAVRPLISIPSQVPELAIEEPRGGPWFNRSLSLISSPALNPSKIKAASSFLRIEARSERPASKGKPKEVKEATAASIGPALAIPSRFAAPTKEAEGVEQLLPNFSFLPLANQLDEDDTQGEELAPGVASLVEEEPASIENTPIIGEAERIIVPSVGIDMPVRTGSYDSATNTWEVDASSAFHADTTVPVNDSNGSTLIYGHAKWGVFGNLPDIGDGAEATVYTPEGDKFVYVFESTRQVNPTDVSMLTAEGEPRLILQTCSGLFDQHRILVTFRLKEVIQAS